MKKPDITTEDRVILKPVFGIQPVRYIPVLYILVCVLILFAVLILPGILHNGALITVETNVPRGALWVDGIYAGDSSQPVFVPKGDHTLVVTKPYFEDRSLGTVSVPGRLFGSLFSARKVSYEAELSLTDLHAYLSWRLASVAAWSPVRQYSETYFYPEILQRTALDLVGTGNDDHQLAEQFMYAALGYIVSEEMYDDFLAALELLDPTVTAPIRNTHTFNLVSSFMEGDQVSDIGKLLKEVPANDTVLPNEIYELDGRMYTYFPQIDQMLLGDADGSAVFTELPYTATIPACYMAHNEITEQQYASFTKQDPRWAAENLESLIDEGLVDRMYLQGVDLENPTDRSVRGISYHAAAAYCSWYTSVLQEQGYDLVCTLPSDAQWESAAVLSLAENSYSNRLLMLSEPVSHLTGLFGSLWELTATPYVPNGHLFTYDGLSAHQLSIPPSPVQMTVKGGSYENSGIHTYTRGSIGAESCSPYIGFRTILQER
jgi:hypothetical protein